MKGRAPKEPATGSQLEPMRKGQPNFRIAGADSQDSATTSPPARTITIHTAARTTPWNTRSPDRRRPMPLARGGGDGRSPTPIWRVALFDIDGATAPPAAASP